MYIMFIYTVPKIITVCVNFTITENRGEFLEKLQRARSQVKPNTCSTPILSKPGPTRIVVGNWSLSSRKESELHIHNSDGQQVYLFFID